MKTLPSLLEVTLTRSGLDADYAFGFDAYYCANKSGLWRRAESVDDTLSLMRQAPDLPPAGGCIVESQGEAHPEAREYCFGAKGPQKLRYEGGPAAYRVDYTLERVP